jgi:N-alpha-acetyl-L-2,4-diaminobutyrate deacetylase
MTDTSIASKISPSIELDRPGKRWGTLVLPHSRDDSAWGSIRIPIGVIKNGEGSTALLIAGNHGDEYEGQIALRRLMNETPLEDVSGTVIVLPGMNFPAVRVGARCSPIDGGNMNRAFPGRPDGTITEIIAHYVTHHLVSRADLVLDLHSGGKTLDFVPFAATHRLPDTALTERARAAAQAFGAPVGLVMLELDDTGMLDGVVERAGKLFVTTELAGAGSSTALSNRITWRGVRNVLRHAGVLSGALEVGEVPTRMMDMPDASCFVTSEHTGIHEPLVDLGEEVANGQPIARIHFMEEPSREPVIYYAARAGLLIGRHVPGLVKTGDFLISVAVDL